MLRETRVCFLGMVVVMVRETVHSGKLYPSEGSRLPWTKEQVPNLNGLSQQNYFSCRMDMTSVHCGSSRGWDDEGSILASAPTVTATRREGQGVTLATKIRMSLPLRFHLPK